MVLFLAGLILLGLASFGGVLHWTFLVMALCSAGASAILFTAAALKGRIDLRCVPFVAASLACAAFGSVRLAVVLIPAAWAVVSFKRNEAVLKLFRILIFFGVAEAALGLVQTLSAPRWILGYHNAIGSPTSGTLINRNHYAGLLELLVPLAFGIAFMEREKGQPAKAFLAAMTAILMSAALVSSLSRMGTIALLISITFTAFLARRRLTGTSTALSLTFFFASLLGFVLWIGIDTIMARFEQLTDTEAVMAQARTIVYKDTLLLIQDHPFGVGMEHYQDQFRRYQTWHPELLFDHAHNEYLETTAELGIPIALMTWICILFLFIRGVRGFFRVRSFEAAGLLLGCIGGLTALLVHSFVDFNLQIPVNGMIFFTLLGTCTALARVPREKPVMLRGYRNS